MKALFCLMLILSYITVSCEKDSDGNDAVRDIEGNVYHIVNIGTQVWMMENLKSTKYNDSTSIPLVTDASQWENLNSAGYCWYDNDGIANKDTYGALYNWNAVNTGKLAPDGWHVATDEDWTILITYLGGADEAGGKLKEMGTGLWETPNTGATNESDFTAIPGGYRHMDGEFSEIGQSATWWSSTSANTNDAYFRGIGFDNANISRNNYNKRYGFSVRCVKD
jgi:uncharacterized protein (TIGR02145 family)